MIKTIIFDYAGVVTLTQDKSLFAQQHHKQFNLSPSELMDVLYKNWHDASVNKISDKQYWKLLSNDLNIDKEELKKMIISTFPIDLRMIDILNQLQGHYALIMMSNQIEDWLESEIDNNNLRDKFDYFINSYQVGIKKPDKEIFQLALRISGSKPEESLFIDDSVKNIESAKQLGIKTILFESFEQFTNDLNKFVKIDY